MVSKIVNSYKTHFCAYILYLNLLGLLLCLYPLFLSGAIWAVLALLCCIHIVWKCLLVMFERAPLPHLYLSTKGGYGRIYPAKREAGIQCIGKRKYIEITCRSMGWPGNSYHANRFAVGRACSRISPRYYWLLLRWQGWSYIWYIGYISSLNEEINTLNENHT